MTHFLDALKHVKIYMIHFYISQHDSVECKWKFAHLSYFFFFGCCSLFACRRCINVFGQIVHSIYFIKSHLVLSLSLALETWFKKYKKMTNANSGFKSEREVLTNTWVSSNNFDNCLAKSDRPISEPYFYA